MPARLQIMILSTTDEQFAGLFRRIMNNSEHVLQPFFPDRPVLSTQLLTLLLT